MLKLIYLWKRWRLARRCRKAQKLIKELDSSMVSLKYSRQQRRQWWRDFVKSSELRQEVFKDLTESR